MKCKWRVDEDSRQALVRALDSCSGPGSTIPSSFALSRYLNGFFGDCQHHMPVIHAATFDISSLCRLSPELVLAVAAVGAIHRFQKAAAEVLYQAAQSLASAKAHLMTIENDANLNFMQALVLLEMYSLWEKATPISLMTPSLQNHLLDCARNRNEPSAQTQDWASWTVKEVRIRLSIAAFCVLSIRSVFHHTSPAIVANEVLSTLPSSMSLWEATCPTTWAVRLASETPALHFREAYILLMSGEAEISVSSPFGCFALLQAIMQRIDQSRKMSLSSSLGTSEVAEIE